MSIGYRYPVSPSRRPGSIFRKHSVRTQLIAWNVAALTVLLGALGFIVRYSVKSLMLRSIDTELQKRARPPRDPQPPGRPGPDRGGPDNEPVTPQGMAEAGPAPDGGPPEGMPRPPRASSPDADGDASGPPPPRGGPGGPAPEEAPYRPVLLNMQGTSVNRQGRQQPWDIAAFNEMRSRAASVTLSAAGIQVIDTVNIDGMPFRLLTQARQDPQWKRAILQVPYPLTDVYRAISELDRALLTLIPIALLCAAAGGWFLTGRVLVRVSRMTATAGGIGVRDLSQRLPVAGDDEFAELASTFNGMLGRLESVFNRQERLMEQQRQFTADASHELKTPLTIIKGNTSLALSNRPTEAEYRQSIVEIDEAATTMSQLVQDLLLLARSDSGLAGRERIDVPVAELLQQALYSTRPPQQTNTAAVVLKPVDTDLCVIGNQNELTRLVKNLLDNAVQYSHPHGTVTASAKREGDWAVLEITDTGIGIAPEHLPHLGERFYRVDTSRTRPTGGTGLGLSICKGIVEAHGGSMRFESRVGKGTTVTVRLPASAT